MVKPSNNYAYEGEISTKFSLKGDSELYTTALMSVLVNNSAPTFAFKSHYSSCIIS